MTVEGEKALRAEHEHLTKNVRIQLSKEIAAARELGDLKENAEYLSLIHISEPTRPS